MKSGNLSIITELRHELHRHPELPLREVRTGERIRSFLAENTSLEIVNRDGWFYAVRYGTDPESGSIAFRADMDALPMRETSALPYASECEDVSHQCGHDGHCAALCGLALELERTACDRTVYLIFQPAEEIGAGGKRCAGLIREKGIAEVYAFHNLSGFPEGTVVYRRGLTQPASEGMEIRFHGKPSHASAPEQGSNPAAALAETVLYAQRLAAEPHRGVVLCTVAGMQEGRGDYGISPGEGTLCLTLRAEEEEELRQTEGQIRDFASARAEEAGLTAEFLFHDRFPETRNSGEGINRVLAAAERLQIPAVEMHELWRASEDFGYYLKECPGALFYLGNGEKWPGLHTGGYDFNDRLLEPAVDLFYQLAVNSGRGSL